jgi:hypothetical protein
MQELRPLEKARHSKRLGISHFDVEQPRERLALMHVPLTPPSLWVGPRVGNLHHVQALDGETSNPVRIRSIQGLEQLRAE